MCLVFFCVYLLVCPDRSPPFNPFFFENAPCLPINSYCLLQPPSAHYFLSKSEKGIEELKTDDT